MGTWAASLVFAHDTLGRYFTPAVLVGGLGSMTLVEVGTVSAFSLLIDSLLTKTLTTLSSLFILLFESVFLHLGCDIIKLRLLIGSPKVMAI